ncbi:hypothetical protein AK812_SmicGene13193 [Symbiodinium microadriaticum]|uniref:Uncharacterized protein n=1 Tax=Symbiodinium microadriaticum TaxID=2951 RepID=A0A1Q9E8S4_SYMMI|nr:hypothetical protein AK812_SmicGene13193 [Symbiodinium microadriaticum]
MATAYHRFSGGTQTMVSVLVLAEPKDSAFQVIAKNRLNRRSACVLPFIVSADVSDEIKVSRRADVSDEIKVT